MQALHLARALQNLGADVEILTTQFTPHIKARDTIDGLRIRALPVWPRTRARPSQMLAALAWVKKHAHRFDIIHGHAVSATCLGAAWAARWAKRPVLLKPSLGGVYGDLAKIQQSPTRPALSTILRNVDRFCVLNDAIAGELRSLGVSNERLWPVTNGIDRARFRPPTSTERAEARRALGLDEATPAVLFVGQLTERKGIPTLLETWRQLSQHQPNARLLVAGEGPLASTLQNIERGTTLGLCADTVPLYWAADVFVLPSQAEGFENVVLEALACGVPVVTGPYGAAAQMGVHGRAGTIVDLRPNPLAKALHDLLKDHDTRHKMATEGPNLIEPFDLEALARTYLDLYRTLVNETSSADASHVPFR